MGSEMCIRDSWWDVPYKGSMDDLRIYGSALTDAEISSIAR